MQVCETSVEQFGEKLMTELSAAATAPLVIVGHRLGMWDALAQAPASAGELARRAHVNERCALEWLCAQAAAGYVEYDAMLDQFNMNEAQIAAFTDEDSPMYAIGHFYGLISIAIDEEKVAEAYRSGGSLPWGMHNSCLFCGTELSFRPEYINRLLGEWIPALDGMEEKLRAGVRVADVGCGHGLSTLLMAEAFPKSQFTGFDYHKPSIKHAAEIAREKGLRNIRFECAGAQGYDGEFDLISFFDSLHDMGDPVGVMRYAKARLEGDGMVMLVEPFAHDELEKNFTPVGRMSYAFSAMICTLNALSQDGGMALGAQAGPGRLKAVAEQAGFARVRTAAETPFNLVMEARK
ncbi:MAG: methyltransferase domain-containing protein [bacterium]|nr:methyltransferase domain-containing protein [bacterium]